MILKLVKSALAITIWVACFVCTFVFGVSLVNRGSFIGMSLIILSVFILAIGYAYAAEGQ